MNAAAIPAFSRHMLSLATEKADHADPVPAPEGIIHPTIYWAALMGALDLMIRDGHSVTRLGLEHMVDALFSHPDMAPALDDPYATTVQSEIEARLPQFTDLLQNHWRFIIRPAWAQHMEIRRAILDTQDQPAR